MVEEKRKFLRQRYRAPSLAVKAGQSSRGCAKFERLTTRGLERFDSMSVVFVAGQVLVTFMHSLHISDSPDCT